VVSGQEVSKPVVIAVIAVAVILIGLLGYYFMKPKEYPGYRAPTGPAGMGGSAVPGMIPGQEPGRTYPPPGQPR
jgi:hypothetical protein